MRSSNLIQYNFTRAFPGVNGVSVDRGFTTPGVEERAIKAAAVRMSRESWFPADSSKFEKVYSAGICTIQSAGIITDRLPDESDRNYTTVKEADFK